MEVDLNFSGLWMDEYVKEKEGAVWGLEECSLINGLLDVRAAGVHEKVKGDCVELITDGTDAIIQEVPVI